MTKKEIKTIIKRCDKGCDCHYCPLYENNDCDVILNDPDKDEK